MDSFLLIASLPDTIQEQIDRLCSKYNIHKYDVTNVTSDKAIGIEDIKNIKEHVFLSPRFGKAKTVIINTQFGITTEAQNALLKLLEEPPTHTVIVITSPVLEPFLPTIISRCKVTISEAPIKESTFSLDTFFSYSIGGKLVLAAQKSKTKEEALQFLENIASSLKQDIFNTHSAGDISKKAFFLKEIQTAYRTLKTTNMTPRFVLEHLFLL